MKPKVVELGQAAVLLAEDNFRFGSTVNVDVLSDAKDMA
jgi:hypothetical protein